MRTAGAAEIAVGVNYLSFDYQEQLTAPSKSTESGWVPLLYGRVRIPTPSTSILGSKGFVEFEGEAIVDANTNYDGTTLSTNAPASATDKNTFMRFEANAFFSLTESAFFHVGYGYRYWKRYLTFGSGYKEVYTWSYFPVGFLILFANSDSVKIGLDVVYKTMFAGKINVIFSETVVNGNDSTLDLGNQPGYKISLPMDFAMTSQMKLMITPWYEHSEIGASNTAYNSTPTSSGVLGYIQEPASKTNQYGVVAGISILTP